MSFDYDLEEMDEDSQLDMVSVEEGFESDFDEGEMSFDDVDFEALGIDPTGPTHAKPGSEEKVLMLAARYAAGVALWHDNDCYDHGPGESSARLFMPPQMKN